MLCVLSNESSSFILGSIGPHGRQRVKKRVALRLDNSSYSSVGNYSSNCGDYSVRDFSSIGASGE